jgi:dynein light intermediate chain
MITPSHSLVRYDNPVLVSRTDAAGKAKGAGISGANAGGIGGVTESKTRPPLGPSGGVAGVKKQLPPVDDKGRAKTPTQTEDILNSILPPRLVCACAVGARACLCGFKA